MSTWDPPSIAHTAPQHPSSSALTAEPSGLPSSISWPHPLGTGQQTSACCLQKQMHSQCWARGHATQCWTLGAVTQPHPHAQPGHTVGPRGTQQLKPSGRFLISKLGLRYAARVLFISRSQEQDFIFIFIQFHLVRCSPTTATWGPPSGG